MTKREGEMTLSKESQCEKGGIAIPKETAEAGTNNVAQEPERERRLRYLRQFVIILGTTLGYQNEGLALSWPNTFASDVQTDRTTLFNTTLNVEDWQMDMMSSSLFIGAIPATVVSGWLVSMIGRRKSMMLAVVPIVISWMCVALAPNTAMVLTGRFLVGVGYALNGIAVRSYLAEVPDTNIRGAAGVMTEVMKGIGAIVIIGLGMVLPWYYLALFCCFHFMFFGLVIVPFLPESPTYLVMENKTEEATKVLRYLKGPYADLDDVMRQLKKQNERADGIEGWGVLLKPDILKKCFIIFGLFVISNFCGSEVIRGNATRMLQSSGMALDQDVSTIIVFVILLSGNIVQVFVLDRIGRRGCLVLSLTLVMFAYTLMGTYIYITTPEVDIITLPLDGTITMFGSSRGSSNPWTQWEWVPTVCLMVAAFSISLGIGSIPWVLSSEYFPTNIRPKVLSVCIIIGNCMAIVALQLFSPLQQLLTPAGLFWCYACFAGIGILYTVVFVHETKGINVG